MLNPLFFVDEDLAANPPLARILFEGLWCAADRMGRLEDRPERLRVQILPFDGCEVGKLLEGLVASGHIIRYQNGGKRFIQIRNFGKFQRPHVRETESVIPPPEELKPSRLELATEPELDLNLSGSVEHRLGDGEAQPRSPVSVSGSSNPVSVSVLVPAPRAVARFTPPEFDEVLQYAATKNQPPRVAQKFHAHYTSNGWKVGKNPMKNWKAAFVNWITPQ